MSRLEGANRNSTGNLTFQKKTKDKLLSTQAELEPEKDSILQTWEEIEQIRRENKELREEIETESRANNMNGPVLEVKMKNIQEISSLIAQKIEVESQKKRDLETLTSISQENVQSALKKMNQSNGVALPQLQAKIKQLEYKLEKTRGRHNESLAMINMLKEEVNMVRRERVIFSNVFKKLESDIKLKDEEFKKYMIEKMHVDAKKRQLEEELQKIKAHAKREVSAFKTQYQQLFSQKNSTDQQDYTSNSQQNNSTILVSNQNNNNKRIFDTEVILPEQSTQFHGHDAGSGLSHNNQAPAGIHGNAHANNRQLNNVLEHKSSARTPQNKQNTAVNLQATQEELQKYQFMFQKVQKEVGIDDLDQLIYLFQNIERENDELYQSANTKSDEIDELEKKIKDVEKEINGYSKHKDSKQKDTTQQDKNQAEVVKLQKKIENTEAMTKSVNGDIRSVTEKLMKIAEKYNVKHPKGEELDDASFIGFLKDIESRVNDILNMTLFCEGKVVNISSDHDPMSTVNAAPKKKQESAAGVGQVLEGVKKKSDSESERILTKGDFGAVSNDEIKQFKDNKQKALGASKGKSKKM